MPTQRQTAEIRIQLTGAQQAAQSAHQLADALGRIGGSATNLQNINPLGNLRPQLDQLQQQSGRAGAEAGESMSEGFTSKLGAMKAGIAALGAGIGATLAASISQAMDREGMNAKLAAQLDLSRGQAATAGKLAGRIYAGNYGENLEEVNDSIRSVAQNLGVSLNGGNIERFSTKLLNLASAFPEGAADADQITQSINSMIGNGLVPNIDSAFDLITRGFQTGANRGGEFLDTLNEYAAPVKALGLSAAEFTTTITRGFDDGAFSADKLGDAIKEFSIRSRDGSTTTIAGFKALGLDAKKTAAQIGAGGPEAKRAFSQVIDQLVAMKDPLKQQAAGVALFGAQYEDLGLKGIRALKPMETGLNKVDGAADRMDKTLGNTSGATVEKFKRRFQLALTDIGAAAIRFAQKVSTHFNEVKDAVNRVITPLRDMGRWLTGTSSGAVALQSAAAGLASVLAVVALRLAVVRTGMIAMSVVSTVTAAVSRLRGMWIALNLVMAANPVGAVVLALVGLGAALYTAYRRSETFRNAVNATWSWIKDNWPLLTGVLTGGLVPAIMAIVRHWDDIKSAASSALSKVKGVLGSIVGTVTGMPGRISNAASGMFDGIKNAFTSAINFIIRAWNSLEFHIPGFDPPGPGPKFGGVTIGVPDIPEIGNATGGVVTASGWRLVGENGPELARFPTGAVIFPAALSRQLSGLGATRPLTSPDVARARAAAPAAASAGQMYLDATLNITVQLDNEVIGRGQERRRLALQARQA